MPCGLLPGVGVVAGQEKFTEGVQVAQGFA